MSINKAEAEKAPDLEKAPSIEEQYLKDILVSKNLVSKILKETVVYFLKYSNYSSQVAIFSTQILSLQLLEQQQFS